ncbi:chloroplast protein FOR GROWTH AND FERTILITY 2-like [Silene latifolia]|uniref:chloroplast protein FOR GROWTH AND FERTILITY 2-like n=1 Tax=Silene latifolia TaxID=37657 RepID=UPI003D77EA86
MERLINSSSISSSKLHNDIPQLGRVNSHKLGGFTESRRVNLAFPLKLDRFRSGSSCFSKKIEPFLVNSHLGSSISCGSEPEPGSELQASSDVNCKLQKVIAIGKLALLSALAMIVINPALPLPAFASFQTATKAGGAVGRGLLRIELLSSAWTGFLAGCLHTLSGPDHLAALAPLSIGRSRLESAAVGALWGCGHDAGQLIFGLLFLLLKDRLHIEIIRTWGTRVVGLTLLVIGAMGIKEALEIPAPIIATENGEIQNPLVGKKKIGFATFATGVVHGLQPDALLIILPALALPSRLAGAAFLGMFLVGTVVAMGGFTVFIGSCSQALKERVPRITEKLTWASSLVAIGLGLAIIMSQFLGFSLY